MTSNVSAGQSSYQNIPIADSGARIPQHIKEVDRNQKFKFFECLQALMKGRLPTNEQLDHFLSLAEDTPALDARAHMLSADGRALHNDFKELMRVVRGIIYRKNEQELFQNFIYHCTQATDSVAQDVQAPDMDVGVSSRKAKKEGQDILDNLVGVAKLVTTNSDFRSILNELFQLASEIFCEGADKVAQNAQTAGDKLSSAVADHSQNAAETSLSANDRLQQEIRDATYKVQDVAEQSKADPVGTARDTRDDIVEQGSSVLATAKSTAKQMFSRTGQSLKDDTRAKASALKGNAIDYAQNKMPPQRREALIERLKLVMGQIQADPQYHKAIDSIMNLFGTWRQRAKSPAGNISSEAGKVTSGKGSLITFKERGESGQSFLLSADM
jgi:hypothetical protein